MGVLVDLGQFFRQSLFFVLNFGNGTTNALRSRDIAAGRRSGSNFVETSFWFMEGSCIFGRRTRACPESLKSSAVGLRNGATRSAGVALGHYQRAAFLFFEHHPII